MEAVVDTHEQAVVLYPNSDAGGRRMIGVIEEYRKNPDIKIFKNLDHDTFLGLMGFASVMIGNSSSGIIEAPSFGLPVVNIGLRQLGRDRAGNVIDTGHKKEDISRGIKKALHDKVFREKAAMRINPYGDGKASEKIVKILGEKKLGMELLQKRITY
jgi:UDP-N-acetylglucosamine 2-epimerase